MRSKYFIRVCPWINSPYEAGSFSYACQTQALFPDLRLDVTPSGWWHVTNVLLLTR